MKNSQQYVKLFSRDFTLPSVEAWVRGECTNPKRWTNQQQPFLPYIVTHRSDDTVHFYYNLQGVDWVCDLLAKLAHHDKKFLENINATVLKKLFFIRPIYEKEASISYPQLIRFLTDLEAGYPWFEAMWWFCQMDESKLAGLNLTKIQKTRALTDTLCNSSDTVIRKSLTKIFPKLGELSSVLLIREITNKNVPTIQILKKRYNEYFFSNDRIFINTTKNQIEKNLKIRFKDEKIAQTRELRGNVAQRGIVKGFVRIIMGHQQIHKMKEGEILVSPMTIPDFLPAMKKAAAVVTDEGGILCHAAIVARELNKPCIVGTKFATQLLINGDYVLVDANNGIVTILDS